jgi:hypothetical protein
MASDFTVACSFLKENNFLLWIKFLVLIRLGVSPPNNMLYLIKHEFLQLKAWESDGNVYSIQILLEDLKPICF